MHIRGGEKNLHSACMYNEGNVFVQFAWLGGSLSYILFLKGAEAAHFDFPAPENDAEMILELIPECTINCCHAVVESPQPLMDDTVDICIAIEVYWPFSEAC